MAYRRKTLRHMPEHTRELARLVGDLESVARRLNNELANIEDMERWNRVERKRQAYYRGKESVSQTDRLADL